MTLCIFVLLLKAIMWLDELFEVMLISHAEVGCNVIEIQRQKEEQQNFEETAKVRKLLLKYRSNLEIMEIFNNFCLI